jgi:hypothetical protein
MTDLVQGVKADSSIQAIGRWQHNDMVYQRQGLRIAHLEKPVLGRGYE